MIHCELCKRLNFNHTDPLHMHKLESILKNKVQEIFWDFEVKMERSIQARKPDLVISYKEKRNCQLVDFTLPAANKMKLKESKN